MRVGVLCVLSLLLCCACAQLAWNVTLPDPVKIVGLSAGWNRLYISSGTIVLFLDPDTGKITGSQNLPSQGCYIYSGGNAIAPLSTFPDTAVAAAGNALFAFKGTSVAPPVWRTPYFPCTNLYAVGKRTAIITNFTTFGIVNASTGDMWTLPYSTYQTYSQVDANAYLIEPALGDEVLVFVSIWPSFGGPVNSSYTLYDGRTGDVLWTELPSRMNISWFQYDTLTDLLIEFYSPNLLRARRFRSKADWDTSAVWTYKAPFDIVLRANGLMFLLKRAGIQAIQSGTGQPMWNTTVTDASFLSAKQTLIVSAGPSAWLFGYSVPSATNANYYNVTLEKRSIADGSVLWRNSNAAFVKYGWFAILSSEDGALAYIYSTMESTWLAAYKTA